VAVADPNDLYNTEMGGGWNNIGGIDRGGSDGSYTYTVRTNRGDRPVNYVSHLTVPFLVPMCRTCC
jgi:hypothetical protein